ncbi:MAG: VanZ family protein [Thermoanaerobaculia bacterium]|nr:VanZ family protein [Thermoanaerobaculia bacterium]
MSRRRGVGRAAAAHLATAAWALAAMALLLLPVESFPGGGLVAQLFPWGPDKLVHTLLFGGLALLASRSLRLLGAPAPLALAALAATAWGALAELAQRLVPGRAPEAADLLADALGAALAVAVVALREARPAAVSRPRRLQPALARAARAERDAPGTSSRTVHPANE